MKELSFRNGYDVTEKHIYKYIHNFQPSYLHSPGTRKTITVKEKDLGGKIYSGELHDGKGEVLYKLYSDRYEGKFANRKRNGKGAYY